MLGPPPAEQEAAATQLGSSFAEDDLNVAVESKLGISQQFLVAANVDKILLGCTNSMTGP